MITTDLHLVYAGVHRDRRLEYQRTIPRHIEFAKFCTSNDLFHTYQEASNLGHAVVVHVPIGDAELLARLINPGLGYWLSERNEE